MYWTVALVLLTASVACADLIQHVVKHPKGDAPFSLDLSSWHQGAAELPIGIFDSGVGGLTVMEAILCMDAFQNETLKPGADGIPDLLGESFQYFGDQANMPYGNYSTAGKTDLLKEFILKDALFLLGKRWFDNSKAAYRFDKPPVKALVIACNTATAYGLEELRAALMHWGIPIFVVGVVEAGSRGVLAQHVEPHSVGVLATVGTCLSGAYPRSIIRVLGLAGRSVPSVTQYGSAALAAVIEGDAGQPLGLSEQCAADVLELVKVHRRLGSAQPLGTIVMGCTHFPLVRDELSAQLEKLRSQPEWQAHISGQIAWVNPAEWTARELFRQLHSAQLARGKGAAVARSQFFISLPNPQMKDLELTADGALRAEYKYGRQAGNWQLEDTVNVPMTVKRLPQSSRQLIQQKLPQVWRALSVASE